MVRFSFLPVSIMDVRARMCVCISVAMLAAITLLYFLPSHLIHFQDAFVRLRSPRGIVTSLRAINKSTAIEDIFIHLSFVLTLSLYVAILVKMGNSNITKNQNTFNNNSELHQIQNRITFFSKLTILTLDGAGRRKKCWRADRREIQINTH